MNYSESLYNYRDPTYLPPGKYFIGDPKLLMKAPEGDEIFKRLWGYVRVTDTFKGHEYAAVLCRVGNGLFRGPGGQSRGHYGPFEMEKDIFSESGMLAVLPEALVHNKKTLDECVPTFLTEEIFSVTFANGILSVKTKEGFIEEIDTNVNFESIYEIEAENDQD